MYLSTGKTALHWAASVNSLEVTKELLRNGAKKDAQDEKVGLQWLNWKSVCTCMYRCFWMRGSGYLRENE